MRELIISIIVGIFMGGVFYLVSDNFNGIPPIYKGLILGGITGGLISIILKFIK